jgi:hypothetical protein
LPGWCKRFYGESQQGRWENKARKGKLLRNQKEKPWKQGRQGLLRSKVVRHSTRVARLDRANMTNRERSWFVEKKFRHTFHAMISMVCCDGYQRAVTGFIKFQWTWNRMLVGHVRAMSVARISCGLVTGREGGKAGQSPSSYRGLRVLGRKFAARSGANFLQHT